MRGEHVLDWVGAGAGRLGGVQARCFVRMGAGYEHGADHDLHYRLGLGGTFRMASADAQDVKPLARGH